MDDIKVPQEVQNQVTVTAPMPPPVPTTPSDTSGVIPSQNPPDQTNPTLNPSQSQLNTGTLAGNQNPNQKQTLPPNAPPQVKGAWTGTHIVKGIADVLSPPQFKTVVNDDGTTSQVKIPRDRRDIGMSIALAALTGAFKGLSVTGPGHTGRAAAAGFDAVAQQRQEAEKQQREQATGDFQRKMSTFETNMKLRAGAVQAGMQDREANDAFSEGYAPVVESLDNPEGIAAIKGGSIENPLSEDELEDIKKNSPFNLTRIPVGKSVPRIGPDGRQVWLDEKTKKVVPEGTPGSHPAWDIRGILVDKNYRVPLSDEKGPKPWVKEIVNHDYAPFIPGANEALTSGGGAAGSVPLSTAMSMYHTANLFKTTQDQLDSFVKNLNEGKKESDSDFIKSINLTDALKRGTIDQKSLEAFQKAAGNTAGVNSTPLNTQIDAVTKSNQTLGNKLQALFGPENLKKYQQKSIAEGAAEKTRLENLGKPMSPEMAQDTLAKQDAGEKVDPQKIKEAQAVIDRTTATTVDKDKRVEQTKEQIEQDRQNEQNSFTQIPQGWNRDKGLQIASLNDEFEARKQLQAQGVQIPKNFSQVWAVAKHDADLKTFPPRVSKGTGQIDAQTAGSYIRAFLNPNYNQGDYEAANNLNKEIASTKQGTAGGSLLAAGTATRHLDSLAPVFKALNNSDYPAWNAILNNVKQQTGAAPQVTANLYAHMVAAEVEKVVAGTPLESRMADIQKDLSRNLSPEAAGGVIRSMLDLMNGRMQEINSRSMDYFGHPVKGISSHTTDFFKRSGFDTPWDQGTIQQKQAQSQKDSQELSQKLNAVRFPNGKPGIKAAWASDGRVIVTQDGKSWVYENGSPYVPPTK